MSVFVPLRFSAPGATSQTSWWGWGWGADRGKFGTEELLKNSIGGGRTSCQLARSKRKLLDETGPVQHAVHSLLPDA